MAVDERSRHELFGKLQEVLGPEPPATFMDLMPPLGTDVATRSDVASLREDLVGEATSLRQEIAAVRQEIAAEATSLRQEIAAEATSLRQEIAAVRQEMAVMNKDLHKDMELLRFELLAAFRGEITTAITSQTRSMMFTNASLFIAFAGLALSLRVL
jgi:chromatin segregation and condensation protein Rec8/ScpA/Scc1 (kleisin family)